jgi:hypothetical protein
MADQEQQQDPSPYLFGASFDLRDRQQRLIAAEYWEEQGEWERSIILRMFSHKRYFPLPGTLPPTSENQYCKIDFHRCSVWNGTTATWAKKQLETSPALLRPMHFRQYHLTEFLVSYNFQLPSTCCQFGPILARMEYDIWPNNKRNICYSWEYKWYGGKFRAGWFLSDSEIDDDSRLLKTPLPPEVKNYFYWAAGRAAQ